MLAGGPARGLSFVPGLLGLAGHGRGCPTWRTVARGDYPLPFNRPNSLLPNEKRGFMKRLLLIVTVAMLCLVAPAIAQEIKLGDFSAGDLKGWEEKSFAGSTSYELVKQDGRQVLKAVSEKAASGLFKEVEIDLKKYPILRWSWKVEGVLAGGDALTKAGDDYPARIYIVFPAFLFWNTRGINYIWANKLPQGEAVPNAYASQVIMVAVESGSAKAGQWMREERNVYEDYKKLFNEEPPALGAVAIMTDTDNTGGRAVAYYGDITLSAK